MSHEMTAAVWARLNLSGGKLMLALSLADHADPDGTSIFPAVATLAWYTRQDVRTVQRQLRELRAIGWLELVRERVPRFQSREYRIAPSWVGGGNLPGLSDRPPRRNVSAIRLPPALDAQRGDAAMSPNSSVPIKTLKKPDVTVKSARARHAVRGVRRGLASETEPLEVRIRKATTLCRDQPQIENGRLKQMFCLSDQQLEQVRATVAGAPT